MPIERSFLGWNEPYLDSAADFLLERYTPSNGSFFIDCSPAVVTLMGSRASRRLLEVMTFKASELGFSLIPPRFTTVGGLPLLLYPIEGEQALPATKLFAWVKALQNLSTDQLEVIVPHPPKTGQITEWLSIAKLCERMFEELSGANLSFADVAATFSEIEDFLDDPRWEILSAAFNNYKTILDNLKLIDRNIFLTDILNNKKAAPSPNYEFSEIFLVATSDLDSLLKGLLAKSDLSITALIHAPETLAENFDEYGCLITEKWSKSQIEIPEDHIKILENPAAQAKEVARLIGDTPAASVTVGVADQEVEPYIIQVLKEKGLPARSASGIPFTATRPYAVLAALSSYITQKNYNSFAEFVRLIDIQDYIIERAAEVSLNLTDFFAALDSYQEEHAQSKLSPKVAPNLPDEINKVLKIIEPLITPFKDSAPKPLAEWLKAIAEFLVVIFNKEEQDPAIIHSTKEIGAVLEQYSTVPSDLLLDISAKNALQIILGVISSKQIPLLGETDTTEVLGWLELHPDDAPLLIVTGFNEGFVPESQNSDAFLPDKLRCRLPGLNNNLRRYARDAYVLSAILQDRTTYILAGKRSAKGDPLAVSRLLFATDKKTIAERISRFYQENKTVLNNNSEPEFDSSNWKSPMPTPLPGPVVKLNVTDYADYINCPYRFYLKKFLHLERYDDRINELESNILGTVLHEVLHSFAISKAANSEDPAVIQQQLEELFDKYVAKNFGDNLIPAAKIQLAQLRFRLEGFAAWQAKHHSQGWEIVKTEYQTSQPFSSSAGDVELYARIDRIDHNRNTGEYFILDYKTGNSSIDVKKYHLKGKRWVNLQLPLYHYLAVKDGSFGDPYLGFIKITAEDDSNLLAKANWSSDEIEEAVDYAREITANIIQEKFWPPNSDPDYDNFSDVCGTNCLVDDSTDEFDEADSDE